MRYLLITLLLLGAAIGFGLLAQHDPGYVLINYSGWSIESSFSIFMLAALLAFSVFYLVLRL
ncbi:MAG: heme biosynthesis protein HemY, partial [Gammaproteobacteria bacterium]|nr:heme biosynthesis protein HemY [Gammaproteobacteria bacterium]